MEGVEVLKSLAKTGSRRAKSDSLHCKGCNMCLTADNTYGPSPCERSSLALLVMDLCVSIIEADTKSQPALSLLEIQFTIAPDMSAVELYFPFLKITERHFSGFGENLMGSTVDEDNVFMFLLLQRERKYFPFHTE